AIKTCVMRAETCGGGEGTSRGVDQLALPVAWLLVAALAALSAGCASQALPDPRDAALAYADAAKRGDSAAIYGMLTSDAQRTHGAAGTRKLVDDAKQELARGGEALASPATQIEARANVRYADGED